MINKFKLSLFVLVLLAGCKNFEPQVLDDDHQLAIDEGVQKGMPASQYNGGYLDDFSQDIAMWWSASPDLIVTKKGDTLRIDSKNVGSKYVPFGREFQALDMLETPVLKVRMRYEGMLAPNVRIDLADIYGKSADQVPAQRLRKGGWRDYYYVYNGKWKQFWPKAEPVDGGAINKISVFFNPGTADWTGTVFIDDIQFVKVSDIPAKKPATVDTSAATPAPAEKEKATATTPAETAPTTTTNAAEPASDNVPTTTTSSVVTPTPTNKDAVNMPVSAPGVLIDDFSNAISSWWSSNESKIKISKEEEKMKVEFKEAGPAYETFGRGFSKIDFSKTPVVKVRVQVKGAAPTTLRADIKDVSGFSTNAKPISIKLQSGTDFVDYYYDFTGKFEQAWPNVQKVEPQSIVELILFVNPGGQSYTGTLYIDEIKAISLEDFKNKK